MGRKLHKRQTTVHVYVFCKVERHVAAKNKLLGFFSFQQWLFGYELTDTLLVFAKSSLDILASKKKIDFLKPLQEAQKKHEGFPTINLHLRDKVLLKFLSVLDVSVDYNGRQSAICRTKTLNGQSISFCTDILTNRIRTH